jgi:hypothetical protein
MVIAQAVVTDQQKTFTVWHEKLNHARDNLHSIIAHGSQ